MLPLNFEDLERAAMELGGPPLRSVEVSYAGWHKVAAALTTEVQARMGFKATGIARQSLFDVPLVLVRDHSDAGYTMIMSDWSRRFVAFSG